MSEEPLSPRIEFFSKKRPFRPRQYYFRFRAANGQIVAASNSRGYSRRVDAIRTASNLRGTLIDARMFDMDNGGSEIE